MTRHGLTRRGWLQTIALAHVMRPPHAPARAFLESTPPERVGLAERDITPAIGMEQPGNYFKVFHTAFHDPCKVRAAVFDDGRDRVAIVSVDALMVPRNLVERCRKRIAATTGIPESAILIAATHSHSSGPTGMVQPGEYDHASELVRKLAYEHSSCADPRYLERLESEIVEAVRLANEQRRPARCSFAVGRESGVSFNRRIRMKNGGTWTHPGKGNPENLAYAGPIDPDVSVIGIWDLDNQLLGCLVNFACHATTNPGGISANWIYYLERAIRGFFGDHAVILFLAGFSGDVTQVDNLSPYANPPAEQWAKLVGGRVGAEALRVLLGAPQGSFGPVRALSRVLQLQRRVPAPERVRQALEIVKRDPQQGDRTEWIFAKEIVLLDALIQRQPWATVELQVVQLGPAVLLASPGEMFVEFGLELKQRVRFPVVMPVELANGCVGYVPTEEAFGPRGGGYETRLTSYSNLEPSAGRKIVEVLVELAAELRPSPLPSPPLAPPFRTPWSYGNVPPELYD